MATSASEQRTSLAQERYSLFKQLFASSQRSKVRLDSSRPMGGFCAREPNAVRRTSVPGRHAGGGVKAATRDWPAVQGATATFLQKVHRESSLPRADAERLLPQDADHQEEPSGGVQVPLQRWEDHLNSIWLLVLVARVAVYSFRKAARSTKAACCRGCPVCREGLQPPRAP